MQRMWWSEAYDVGRSCRLAFQGTTFTLEPLEPLGKARLAEGGMQAEHKWPDSSP